MHVGMATWQVKIMSVEHHQILIVQIIYAVMNQCSTVNK